MESAASLPLLPVSIAARGVYEVPGAPQGGGVLLYSVDSRGHVEGPFLAHDHDGYESIHGALSNLLTQTDPLEVRPHLRLVPDAPLSTARFSPAVTLLLCRKIPRRA